MKNKTAAKFLEELYLDWVNNFLTVERFAEANELTQAEAIDIIHIACKHYESLGKTDAN